MKAFNRVNRLGQQYYITQIPSNEQVTEIRTGTKKIIVEHGIDRIEKSWFRYIVRNEFVQDAFPYLTADEREFIITGFSKAEWDIMFPTEQETD